MPHTLKPPRSVHRPAALRAWLGAGAMVIAAAGLMGPGNALADVYDQVLRPLQAGQTAQARERAELHLQKYPRDVQMQLILAQVMDAQDQLPQAVATLEALAASYPELPEVHNNLAVLQARQGRLDAALQSLHSALRTRPGYTLALENLGDVHTRLAQQAYERARQTQPSLPRLAQKLEQSRQVLGAHP